MQRNISTEKHCTRSIPHRYVRDLYYEKKTKFFCIHVQKENGEQKHFQILFWFLSGVVETFCCFAWFQLPHKIRSIITNPEQFRIQLLRELRTLR